jgi:hypothetical protein
MRLLPLRLMARLLLLLRLMPLLLLRPLLPMAPRLLPPRRSSKFYAVMG